MSYIPPVSNTIDLIGLWVKLIKYQYYKKYCLNINQYYVLGQVDIKLIDKDLREWVTNIQQSIINIQNSLYKLAARLTKRAVKGGNNSRRVHQSASSKSSTTSTLGIINHFYISFISLVLNQ